MEILDLVLDVTHLADAFDVELDAAVVGSDVFLLIADLHAIGGTFIRDRVGGDVTELDVFVG